MDLCLKDKVVVVVGGAGNLGTVICDVLREEGAVVRIADIKLDSSHDMSKEKLARDYIQSVVQEHRRLDGLITATYGGSEGKPFHATLASQMKHEFHHTFLAPFNSARMAANWMSQNGGGGMVFVSSVNSGMGLNEVAYDVAKGALDRLAPDIAADYGKQGIHAVTLCPGTVGGTPSWEGREEELARIARSIPDGRLTNAREIAQAAAFFLSPHGKMFTGQRIVCDRAWSLVKNTSEWKDISK